MPCAPLPLLAMVTPNPERTLAVFIDLENLAIGFERRRGGGQFNIALVLERLVEKGKIIVKKAYADWSRFPEYTTPFHEEAMELIEIPKRSQTGKNSADIRLVVDAMDLAWSKAHIDTFVIVSGDSDFSPLVSKLKENGKHVIGLGMRDSTSHLLSDNCDEFIIYEDLERQDDTQRKAVIQATVPEQKREAFALLLDACAALSRENHDVLYASMIKDTIQRKKPSFDESFYGFRSFTHLLQEANTLGIVAAERDPRSRSMVVTGFGEEKPVPPLQPKRSPRPPRER